MSLLNVKERVITLGKEKSKLTCALHRNFFYNLAQFQNIVYNFYIYDEKSTY